MRLSIILPTYKEAKNLSILIPQLIERFVGIIHEIIVVDDASQDGTDGVIQKLSAKYPSVKIVFIERQERGIGSALARGYDEATGDLLLSMDADLSLDLDDIPKLLQKLSEGYDAVVGSRYIPGGGNRREAFLNKAVSVIGNLIFDAAFGLPVHDVSLNFRILKKNVWRDIKTEELSNVMLLEMLVNAKREGYKLAEVPVIFTERIYGQSKTRIGKLIPNYLRYIASSRFRYVSGFFYRLKYAFHILRYEKTFKGFGLLFVKYL